MKFAAIHGAFLRSVASSASDAAVGAWVRLLVLASELEVQDGEDPLAGRLAGAAAWTDRALLSATGTDRAGLAEAVAAGLVRVDGQDVVVRGYDADAHAKVATLRGNGKYGKLGGRPGKPSRVSDENPPGFSGESLAEPSGSESETPSPLSPLLSSPSHLPDARARADADVRAQAPARVCNAPSGAQVQTRFKALYQDRFGALPYMGGGEAVRTFPERLLGTAQHRRVDPMRLLTEAFERWQPAADDKLAQNAPYATFCSRFGSLIDQHAGGGLSERDQLRSQQGEALQAGEHERYRQLVEEERRRFGGGRA